jgi:imidazolonepropionase-like amidohydrolase
MTDADFGSGPVLGEISRRGLLAGAAGLAGAGLLAGRPEGASARRSTRAEPGGSRWPEPPPVPQPLVLEGGTLLDPLTGEVTEDAVVVLADRIVLAAGSPDDTARARAQVAGRAEVLDVTGRWLVPGMLDCHTHVDGIASANRALRHGATTLRIASSTFYRDVGLRALSEWTPDVVPRVLAVGLFVRTTSGDALLSDPDLAPLATVPELETPEQLRYFTRVNVSRGVDHIKTWATQRAGLCEQDPRQPTYDVNQLRAIVQAARPLPVMCHSHGTEGCQAAVEAGVGTLEHGTFVSERTLDLMARRGTYYDPTISAVVDLAQPGGEYTDPCLVQRGQEMLPVLKAAVRATWERGVRITAGPDTSYSEESLSSIGGEVALLNEAGVPVLDAIRAATTTAARMVGLERLIGRVARGYSADVLALDGSPLDDITAMQRARLVTHRGFVARNDL